MGEWEGVGPKTLLDSQPPTPSLKLTRFRDSRRIQLERNKLAGNTDPPCSVNRRRRLFCRRLSLGHPVQSWFDYGDDGPFFSLLDHFTNISLIEFRGCLSQSINKHRFREMDPGDKGNASIYDTKLRQRYVWLANWNWNGWMLFKLPNAFVRARTLHVTEELLYKRFG